MRNVRHWVRFKLGLTLWFLTLQTWLKTALQHGHASWMLTLHQRLQLAKTQILQQAGISVLAQANAQPQNVLALLQ